MSTTLRRLAVAATILVVTTLTAACAASSPQLVDRDYLSVAVTEGGAAKQLVAGTRIRLGFEAATLNANAGCNSMGGSYRIEGGRLIFEGAGMTSMGCDPGRHAQDEWLVDLLASKPLISLVGNDLTIEGATTVLRLLDGEVAEPDLNLVGPTWTVDSIITGDAVSSVPAGATAAIVFKADGTVELNPGCNRGGGTWKLQGSGLEITSVIMTKMACQGPGGALESSVMEALSAGALTATIDASFLTIQGPGGGLRLRGG